LAGARIGAECNICDHVYIENDVVLGDRVTVKCGVQLWDGLRVGNDVFLGPNVTFTNDLFPRSKQAPKAIPQTVIEDGASIGANSTLLPGLRLGRQALVGAGSVVTRDVPPGAIVMGNPARITSYVAEKTPPAADLVRADVATPKTASPVVVLDRAALYSLRTYRDMRGSLTVAEFDADLPFQPRRCFVVYDVPSKHVRGQHAHHSCEQLLVCLRGSVSVVLDNGSQRREVLLDSPERGLYVPPRMWCTQYRYDDTTMVLVYASEPYDPDDYYRDYHEFLAAVAADQEPKK